MQFSPFVELANTIGKSWVSAALFAGVSLLPWLTAWCLRWVAGPDSALYRASRNAAIVCLLGAALHLSFLGSSAGLSRAGVWMLLYLFFYVPTWLVAFVLILISIKLLARYRASHQQ